MGQYHSAQACFDACARGMNVDQFEGDAMVYNTGDPSDRSPPDQVNIKPVAVTKAVVNGTSNGTSMSTPRTNAAKANVARAKQSQAKSQPKAAPATGPAEPISLIEPDDDILANLIGMGFSENGAKRAAIAVSNSSFNAAMEWALAHAEDKNFNDPVATASPEVRRQAQIRELMNLGFSEGQVVNALDRSRGNTERAVEMLLSSQT